MSNFFLDTEEGNTIIVPYSTISRLEFWSLAAATRKVNGMPVLDMATPGARAPASDVALLMYTHTGSCHAIALKVLVLPEILDGAKLDLNTHRVYAKEDMALDLIAYSDSTRYVRSWRIVASYISDCMTEGSPMFTSRWAFHTTADVANILDGRSEQDEDDGGLGRWRPSGPPS